MSTPPILSSHDVERDLITILMDVPDALDHLEEFDLSVIDFDASAHRELFAAIMAVHERGDAPGYDTVRAEIDRRECTYLEAGELEIIAAQMVSPSQASGLARQVKVVSLARQAERHAANHEYEEAATLKRRADDLLHGREGRQDSPIVNVVSLADVEPETVDWLWGGYIPLGKITMIDGDPGLGKSTLTLDLAARVSRGLSMPDGSPSDLDSPAGVILLTVEDGLGDTVRPRLDAGDADVARVHAIVGCTDAKGNSDIVTLPGDVAAIEQQVYETGAKLVIIDPLMAFLGSRTNSYRDQDVRRALAPLAQMADRTGAAVVVIRHLNKTGGSNPLHRGGGSIGIIGAARSGLLVAPDPDDESGERRILALTKSNLSRPARRWPTPSARQLTARRTLTGRDRPSTRPATCWYRTTMTGNKTR